MRDNIEDVFFELLRAGLWEKDVRMGQYGSIDYGHLYKLAQEQSVVGLINAGLNHVAEEKVPWQDIRPFVSETLIWEQRNKEMNKFVSSLIDHMRKSEVFSVLVKGQGIAQCYERPLWRSCGDVDLYTDNNNFIKAKEALRPYAQKIDPDNNVSEHVTIVIKKGGWIVEIHKNQHTCLSLKLDRGLDKVHRNIFKEGEIRVWQNGRTEVYLPSVNNDVIIVFTHFLKHFYKGGLGIRQICDWCRLLYTYRESLNHRLLEERIREMGLMSEWKAFAAFAVDFLGMTKSDVPLYSENVKWSQKASYIASFVIESGNFGKKRDNDFYRSRWRLVRKLGSLKRKMGDMIRHARIFPINSLTFFPFLFYNGLKAVSRGE